MKKIGISILALGMSSTAFANYEDAQQWKQLVFGDAKSDHSMVQADERSTRPFSVGDFAAYGNAQQWKQLMLGDAQSGQSMQQAAERSTRAFNIGDYDKGTFGVYMGGGGES